MGLDLQKQDRDENTQESYHTTRRMAERKKKQKTTYPTTEECEDYLTSAVYAADL